MGYALVKNDEIELKVIPGLATGKNETRASEKWVAQAVAAIAESEKHFNKVTRAIERNKGLNKLYAEMYLSNPAIFKWAGMAAMASKSIGEKLQILKFGTFGGFKAFNLPLGLVGLTTGVMNYLFDKVAEGNRAIYIDIYWQHLAYREGGINEIRKIFRQGDISLFMFRAWSLIEKGRISGEEELVWEGNRMLLENEQRNAIQPVLYEGSSNRLLWQMISATDRYFGLLIKAPVPGKASSFGACVPGGNLADFEQRWEWCVKNILPEWRKYEKKYPLQMRKLQRELARKG
jgi:hypothetical protein